MLKFWKPRTVMVITDGQERGEVNIKIKFRPWWRKSTANDIESAHGIGLFSYTQLLIALRHNVVLEPSTTEAYHGSPE